MLRANTTEMLPFILHIEDWIDWEDWIDLDAIKCCTEDLFDSAIPRVGLIIGLPALWFTVRMAFRIWRQRKEKSSSVVSKIHFYSGSASGDNQPEYTEKCIELLSEHPGFVNSFGDVDRHHGYSPFLRACWNGNHELISFMLSIGADINKSNSDGESPLYLVVYRISKNISSPFDDRSLQLLIDRGCRVNQSNVHGNTALHVAAKAGHSELVKYLLLNGADPEVENHMGYNPWHLAMKYGTKNHIEVAKALKIPKSTTGRHRMSVNKSIDNGDSILLKYDTEPIS